jgi:uncharacterized protein (DUF1684 family)
MKVKRTPKVTLVALALSALVLQTISCAPKPATREPVDAQAYAQEIRQFQEKRWAELKSESGWLTLVGLFWLKEGENQFGSDKANSIVLPAGKIAARAGSFWLENGVVTMRATQPGITLDGQEVKTTELKSDAADKPTILHSGSLTFQIIKRNERFGLRVKDSQHPDRLNFKNTEFYLPDFKWRIEGQFEPYNPPKPMPIMTVLGTESPESSPGAIKFSVDGKDYRLDAVSEKNEPRLFMILADQTNGKETYPAGRYLYVDPPDQNGRVVIDFNKAYSPPCAFTKFATCPLPPRQNRLPFPIPAGEKYTRHESALN